MKKVFKGILVICAILSLAGCGVKKNLTFSEVEEKMEYVLMSGDVKIEFYSIDKYGKYYYGVDEASSPSIYFKARIDENGEFISYVVITSEEYFFASRSDNAYGEQ